VPRASYTNISVGKLETGFLTQYRFLALRLSLTNKYLKKENKKVKENQKNDPKMKINDLINDAITNAVIRRGLLEEEILLAISDEEAGRVAGGLAKVDHPIIPESKRICPPIIVGLIAKVDEVA
jgi:hypothetical protein